jgi:hypothetical protein
MKMKAWSTKLQEYINHKLEEYQGFPECNTPAKYLEYCKIRPQVSQYLGVSRPLGIVEYYKACEFIDSLFKERYNENHRNH